MKTKPKPDGDTDSSDTDSPHGAEPPEKCNRKSRLKREEFSKCCDRATSRPPTNAAELNDVPIVLSLSFKHHGRQNSWITGNILHLLLHVLSVRTC